MVSICSILSKKPLCKLFGGASCWIWCRWTQQIYCLLNLCQLQQNKEVCQYFKLPIFFHSQKVFQHQSNFQVLRDFLYLSIHLSLFSTHTCISSQDRDTVLLHIISLKNSTFGDKPKRLFFQRELCSFLLKENRNERGIPEIPLPLALCLKYY